MNLLGSFFFNVSILSNEVGYKIHGVIQSILLKDFPLWLSMECWITKGVLSVNLHIGKDG